ncbi:MAG: hypothetical protein UDM04_01450 [Agathobaculum sp.]|nr:hypothetical protein [Agathobaculum sp.]
MPLITIFFLISLTVIKPSSLPISIVSPSCAALIAASSVAYSVLPIFAVNVGAGVLFSPPSPLLLAEGLLSEFPAALELLSPCWSELSFDLAFLTVLFSLPSPLLLAEGLLSEFSPVLELLSPC